MYLETSINVFNGPHYHGSIFNNVCYLVVYIQYKSHTRIRIEDKRQMTGLYFMTIFSVVSNKYFIVQSVGVTVNVHLCAMRSSQLSEMRVF